MKRKQKQARTVRLAANVTPEFRDRLELERLNIERRTGTRPSLSKVIEALLEKGMATYWQ